ncbi:MAG: hypothetical protein ABID45_02485 [Patescibacteria group bacterium]
MTTEPRPEREIFNEQYYFRLWEDALFNFFTEGSDVPIFEALDQIDVETLNKYLLTENRIYRLAQRIINEWKIQGCSKKNMEQIVEVRLEHYKEKLFKNDIDFTIFEQVCRMLHIKMTQV